jgi:hypothetical protein
VHRVSNVSEIRAAASGTRVNAIRAERCERAGHEETDGPKKGTRRLQELV